MQLVYRGLNYEKVSLKLASQKTQRLLQFRGIPYPISNFIASMPQPIKFLKYRGKYYQA